MQMTMQIAIFISIMVIGTVWSATISDSGFPPAADSADNPNIQQTANTGGSNSKLEDQMNDFVFDLGHIEPFKGFGVVDKSTGQAGQKSPGQAGQKSSGQAGPSLDFPDLPISNTGDSAGNKSNQQSNGPNQR